MCLTHLRGRPRLLRLLIHADTPLTLTGALLQTANLQEWKDAAGTLRGFVEEDSFVFGYPVEYSNAPTMGTQGIRLYYDGKAVFNSLIGGVKLCSTFKHILPMSFTYPTALYLQGATGQTADLMQVDGNKFKIKANGDVEVKQLAGTGTRMVVADATGTLVAGGSANAIVSDPAAGVSQSITAADPADVPLTIQGAAGQTGNLQQWSNDAGDVLAQVRSNGQLRVGNPHGSGGHGFTVSGSGSHIRPAYSDVTLNTSRVADFPQGGSQANSIIGDPTGTAASVLAIKSGLVHQTNLHLETIAGQAEAFTVGADDFVITGDGKVSAGTGASPAAQMDIKSATDIRTLKVEGATGQTKNLLEVDTNKLVVHADGKVGFGVAPTLLSVS